MNAVILAAGVGNRIGAAHQGPKCLLEFAGRSLLERHLEILRRCGVERITLVLGHASEAIVDALGRCGDDGVVVHLNPLYTLGSVVSLWSARQALLSGDDVLLMDADVLYAPQMIERLVETRAADCFLLDRDFIAGDEPVKICLDDNRLVEFGKQIPAQTRYDTIGESVGFFRFSADTARELAQRAAADCASGRRERPHEQTLRELALAADSNIEVEDVTGIPWIEIDFPEDIERARDVILPQVEAA